MTVLKAEDFGANPALPDNAPAFQAAIDQLIGDYSVNISERAGVLMIPPGTYNIANPISINTTVDFRCKIAVMGYGGRRNTIIRQTNAAQPVFRLKSSTQNIRDFHMANIGLMRGTYGLEIENDYYCLFDNVTFENHTEYAIHQSNAGTSATEFRSCWFVQLVGNVLHLDGGACIMRGCVIGEAAGGFDLWARLEMSDCIVFGARDHLNPDGRYGEGNALFRVNGGATLRIDGGKIGVASTVKSIIFFDKGRDIIIDGTHIHTGNAENLIANRHAHTGTKPFPPIVMRPSIVTSTRPEGLCMYKQLDGQAGYCHRNVLYDIGATEYVGVEPFFDPAFLAPSNGNEINIRPRRNLD